MAVVLWCEIAASYSASCAGEVIISEYQML